MMRRRRGRGARTLGAWLLLSVAGATPSRATPATDLAGLFMQSCMPYAGNAAGLRAWAARTGLPEVPDPARAAFLLGAAGVVFDASVPPEKYALISPDDGLCSVVTNHADGAAVIAALEADLQTASVAYRLVIERDDAQIAQIHDREYLAFKNGHGWRILAATVRDPQGGKAMLTAAPE